MYKIALAFGLQRAQLIWVPLVLVPLRKFGCIFYSLVSQLSLLKQSKKAFETTQVAADSEPNLPPNWQILITVMCILLPCSRHSPSTGCAHHGEGWCHWILTVNQQKQKEM